MNPNQSQSPRRFSFSPSPLGIIPAEHLSPDRISRHSTQIPCSSPPGATSTPRNSHESMINPIGTSVMNRLPAGTSFRTTSTPQRTFTNHTHSEQEIIRNMGSLPEAAQRFILTGESMGIDSIPLQLPTETQRNLSQCDRSSVGGPSIRDSTFDKKPSVSLVPIPPIPTTPSCSTQCCAKPMDKRRLTVERNNSMESISIRPLSPVASVNSEIALPPPINFMDELQTRMFPAPTEFYRKKLEKYQREVALGGGDAHRINSELNEMFVRRLTEIDCHGTKDCDIRLITYQEWVEMLLKLNDIVINNMRDLEAEVVERMDLLKCGLANNSLQDETESVSKYRNDVCMLVKLIQNAYFDDNWSMEGMKFHTITASDIIGSGDRRNPRSEEYHQQSRSTSDSSSRLRVNNDQLLANTKALAVEVAHKHDMICNLKKQIACLEDEIQNAQKKIQLKDDVIRELRNDLKCANTKSVKIVTDASVDCNMPPINIDNKFQESMSCVRAPDSQDMNISNRFATAEENLLHSTRSSNSDDTVTEHTARSITTNDLDCSGSSFLCEEVSQCEELHDIDQIESDNLTALFEELDDFYGANSLKKKNLQHHGQRLSAIVKKAEEEKSNAYRKLDCIRRLLVDLEAKAGDPTELTSGSDCDSGISSKCDAKDQDSRIIGSLKKRLFKLNECSYTLKKRVQELEIEKKELETKLNTETCFAKRNCEILKEIADLLSTMTGQPFKYNDAYVTDAANNPFCDAITNIKVEYKTQEDRFVQDVVNMHKKVSNLEQAICMNQEDQDNSLKAQIHQMSTTICDREKQINHMSAMLQQLESKHKTEILGLKENSERELGELRQKLKESNLKAECLMRDLSCLQKNEGFLKGESRKLNDELVEVKQRNQILLAQQNQLKTLLQTQEQHRMDLVKKYETLDENYECQSKKLQTMQTQFVHLQEHLAEMGRSHDSHVHDYQRIQGELMAFKEREATLLGKYTALQEQFRKANTEIDQAHNVIKQQQSIMEHNETLHRNSVKTLQQATESMRAEFHSICEEYKKLKVQYSQQLDVDKHNERVLDSFRKWKEAQTKADAATRLTFKQYEGNIRALLEEKQEFLDEYRKLQRDFHLVQNELTRIRRAAASKRGSGMTLEPDTAIIQRIDLLRNITSRISNHAATVYGDSSSSGDAGKKQNNFDSPNNSSSY